MNLRPLAPYSRGFEALRVAALAAAALALTSPLFTASFSGGTDARWYATILRDFLEQLRSGHFPVWLGQGINDWNGGVHPFRSAPVYLWLAGAWDLLTWHTLDFLVLQHLTAITCALAGGLGFYFAAVALAPDRRWEAALLSFLYLAAPVWLSTLYQADAYMTFMAVAALPLLLYGNARTLLADDGAGYGWLGAGVVLMWACHPPVALVATLATIFLQGGIFLFEPGSLARWRGAGRGALLAAALGAFYFLSMSDLPPRGPKPWTDLAELAGIALGFAGGVRGLLQRRGRPWLLLFVPAAGLLGTACLPWLAWLGCWGALAAAAAAAGRRLGLDPARRTAEIAFPCALAAAALAQACLGAGRPESSISALYGLGQNTAHVSDLFLPASALPGSNDYQPGAALWILLVLLCGAFFRGRSVAVKLFFIAALLPVFALIRIPLLSDFLAGYFPPYIAGIINFPLGLRLLPVVTGLLAMGGIVWLAAEPPTGPGRAGLLGLLAAGALWGGADAWRIAGPARNLRNTPEHTRDLFRPENTVYPHFDYDLLPMPSYFSEGAFDPRLEFRLRGRDLRVYYGPDELARRMEQDGASVLDLATAPGGAGPSGLRLEPGLTLAPGEHVLLRFDFRPEKNYTGWLILASEHGYREYHLPDTGLPRGFGTGAGSAHTLSLWNSGPTAEHYHLSMSREGANDLRPDGEPFAAVTVSHYTLASSRVWIDSWIPLRMTVNTDRPGWIETPRVFLPGYRAELDRAACPVSRSPEKLLMIPVPAGRHRIILRYVGTPKLWIAGAVSTLAWLGCACMACRRRRPAPRASFRLHPASAPEAEGRARRRLGAAATAAGVLVAAAAVAAFELWTIQTSGASIRDDAGARNEYYNQLVAGFQKGHLYLEMQPDPAVEALPPAQRPAWAPYPYLMDASFYRGHYYLYFGVAPAVVLLWPYAALTGRVLPQADAALCFSLLGFAFAAAWWLELRRRLCPRLGGLWAVLGVLAIGFCSLLPSTLRHPLFYELAITSGYAFMMAALWCALRARYSGRRQALWLAMAGVAAGLAFGSRPNLGPSCLVLLALAAAAAAWGMPDGRRRLWRGLLGGAIGFGVIGAGVAIYNFERFGNPFDFGHAYQLGLNPRQMFHLSNLWDNLRIYYLLPPSWNGYFPFVAPGLPPPPPADYIGREHAHGEWIWLPLLALAAVSALAAWAAYRRGRREHPAAGETAAFGAWAAMVLLPGAVFAVNLLILAAAGTRANRYMVDFHPALVLATLLALAPSLAGRGSWRAAARLLAAAGIATAVIFNLFASVEVQGFLQLIRPAEYHRLAAKYDPLVWPWLRREAASVGDRQIEVAWHPVAGAVEPLLATGTPAFDDVLWVHYDGAGHAQLAYQHAEYGEDYGEWFPLAVSGRSTLRVGGAFLLPPVGHPWYGERAPDIQAMLKRRLTVSVDGIVRFDRDVPSYDSSPHLQVWGRWRDAELPDVHVFSGRLGTPAVLPVDDGGAAVRAAQLGAVRLRLKLPQDRFGSIEPLVQSGVVGAFDTLGVRYEDAHTIRLVHDSLGAGASESGPIPVDYQKTQFMQVDLPFATDGLRWVAGEPTEASKSLKQLRVLWNGRSVFVSSLAPHDAAASSLAYGGSDLRSSQDRMMFSGALDAAPRRDPLGQVAAGTLECRLPASALDDDEGILVRFERRDREAASVVWRRSAAGLQFAWLDAGAAEWSPPVRDGSGPFHFAISAPHSAAGVEALGYPVKYEEIAAELGGRRLFSASTDIFSNGPVAASAILGPLWKGSALGAAGEGPPNPRAGAPILPGRIRIRFRLPPADTGGADPLVSAGRTGAADSLYLRKLGDGRFVFGLDHWTNPATESAPLAIDPSRPHTLLVEMSSLLGAGRPTEGWVRLTLDGEVVFSARHRLYPVRPGEVVVGRNPLEMSTSQPEFRGEILSVRTQQPPPELR